MTGHQYKKLAEHIAAARKLMAEIYPTPRQMEGWDLRPRYAEAERFAYSSINTLDMIDRHLKLTEELVGINDSDERGEDEAGL